MMDTKVISLHLFLEVRMRLSVAKAVNFGACVCVSGEEAAGKVCVWVCVSGEGAAGKVCVWVCVSGKEAAGKVCVWVCVSGEEAAGGGMIQGPFCC